MKNILAFLICFSIHYSYSQVWLDGKCKELDIALSSSDFIEAKEKNILNIIINQADEIVINNKTKSNLREIAFKELVLDFVTNPNKGNNKADDPSKVYIQLDSYKETSKQLQTFKTYIQEVYIYLWDKSANEKYDLSYIELNCKKRAKILKAFPLRIIGNNKTEKKNNRPKGIGVPPFSGDVRDN